MPYNAPVRQMTHSLNRIADLQALADTGAFPNFDMELVAPILEEAGKLARDVLAPLNASGHQAGAKLTDDGVVAAPGFKEAYQQFQEGGWMGLAFPERFGGQDLPKPLALAVMEMIHASNMSFGLCPLLTFGSIEALLAHGAPEQQDMYLPKLISGEWTGAMNLTEPQAGSDVGALKSKAVPNADGSYAISGQKIFITWGDHDMTDNVVHLVLARLPDAPAGSKGISLFVAPKLLVNADGSLGERNSFKCIGLEKKMGIHASPTCVMEFDNATGWLVGEPNKGLAAMFTMMNSARLQVGLQGVACGEAAFQAALDYARERKQGRAPGVEGAASIIHHPDIQRSLLTTNAINTAARAICYACGSAADLAERATDDETRAKAKRREDLLTPIAKAWSTDRGVDATNTAVQVYGGMGFMDETEACQLYMDARIAPIYEGTNGIQAMDLVGRKLAANNGAFMGELIAEMKATLADAHASSDDAAIDIANSLEPAIGALETATDWMLNAMKSNSGSGLVSACSYLHLAGDVTGGYYLLKGAMIAKSAGDTDADEAMLNARVFADAVLPLAQGRAQMIAQAAPTLTQAAETLLSPV